MSNIYYQVGKKIRLYRKARKLTQEELGEILQIDQSYIGRIERGDINITLETITKIADALDVKPSQLLEEDQYSSIDKLKSETLDKITLMLLSRNTSELQIVHMLLKEAFY